MKVVNVLRDEDHALQTVLKFTERYMRWIGFNILKLTTAALIKMPNQGGVSKPSLRRGDVLDSVFFPKSTVVPKRSNARLGRNTGTGQDNHPFALHENSSRLNIYQEHDGIMTALFHKIGLLGQPHNSATRIRRVVRKP